jgi:energy-coupling factor transport system ATP-binding protein
MVLHNPDNQFVASTVEEDVAFGLENQACPPSVIRNRVDEALDLVGLGKVATHPPQMLSGGQRQLVAIAGILAVQPACIVFDEPTSMLDPLGRRRILETIQRMNADQGLTVILITQSMAEASMAQRVVAMHGGRVALDGTAREVFDQKEPLRAMRLGLSPIAEVAHHLRERGVALPSGLLSAEELAEALC